ncbi:MAG: hypothetical protein ACLP9N_08795 [Mycobacterium sp.]
MYPLTPDYNQQMFAYVQAWRQFLEQWAAMMPFPSRPAPPVWPTGPFMPAAGQFMAPFMPTMPPLGPQPPTAAAPPTTMGPPAPADYTQQLFGYLQAWRQYLEQMTGACPGSPQAPSGRQPTGKNGPADDNGKSSKAPQPPQQTDIPPAYPGSSLGPASLVDIPPVSQYRSQFRSPGFGQPNPLGRGPDTTQLLNPPDYAFGYRDRASEGAVPATTVVYTTGTGASSDTSEAATQPPVASTFSAIMARVEPNATPLAEPQSLFSARGVEAASAKIEGAGEHSA